MSTSKYIGVTGTESGKWFATIKRGGKAAHIGTFTAELDAASAFDDAALAIDPELTRTNAARFPEASKLGRATESLKRAFEEINELNRENLILRMKLYTASS